MKSSIPVFLVGCGRSGTNMVTRHLATSPDVELFNEDHPAAFERYRLRPLADIRRLIAISDMRFVLFKPILDTGQCLEWLELFPDAKILFAIRHYDDVINSAMRRFGPAKWSKAVRGWMKKGKAGFAPLEPPASTFDAVSFLWRADLNTVSRHAIYWLFFNRLYFDLKLDRDSRVKLVRYEDAVHQPETEFRDICRFLKIDYSARMVSGIYSGSIGKDPRPEIDGEISSACTELWWKLLNYVEITREEQYTAVGL